MYVSSPKGELYGFCPSKVARDDHETLMLFNALVVMAETGQLLVGGGLCNQPSWLIDELAWFLPRYNTYKFAQNASMLFGSDEKQTAKSLPKRKG